MNDVPSTEEWVMPCEREWIEFDTARRALEVALINDAIAMLTAAHAGPRNEFNDWACGKEWIEIFGPETLRTLTVMLAALYPSGTHGILALKVDSALRTTGLLSGTRVVCDAQNGTQPSIRFS
jgi:hypothetical protein